MDSPSLIAIGVVALVGLASAPGECRAQRVTTRVDTMNVRAIIAQMPVLEHSRMTERGDTLVWVTRMRDVKSGHVQADTVIALMMPDTVALLRGGERTLAPPLLARGLRDMREIARAEGEMRKRGIPIPP